MRTSGVILAVLLVVAVIEYPVAILKVVLILALIPAVALAIISAFAVVAIYHRRG